MREMNAMNNVAIHDNQNQDGESSEELPLIKDVVDRRKFAPIHHMMDSEEDNESWEI
jgi:hypothetical protein